jgi:hypothetical protein
MGGWRNYTTRIVTIKCPAEKDKTKGKGSKRERIKKNQGVEVFDHVFDKKTFKKPAEKKSAYRGNYFPEPNT